MKRMKNFTSSWTHELAEILKNSISVIRHFNARVGEQATQIDVLGKYRHDERKEREQKRLDSVLNVT